MADTARPVYPLMQKCDMPEEMRVEAQEICVTACEKFAANNEHAAKLASNLSIKKFVISRNLKFRKKLPFVRDQMDKKFGSGWHVVIGQSFDTNVTSENKSLLYMFIGGTTAVLVWKCS